MEAAGVVVGLLGLAVGAWNVWMLVCLLDVAAYMRANLNSIINAVNGLRTEGDDRIDSIEELCVEMRNSLVEASAIKRMREGVEPAREAVRNRRFVGVSERRAEAEKESYSSQSHSAKVIANNIKAMEG